MAGIPFTAIEKNYQQVDFVRRFGNKVYYGDASRLELLESAKARDAKLFVLAIDDVEASVKTAALVRKHFPEPADPRARAQSRAPVPAARPRHRGGRARDVPVEPRDGAAGAACSRAWARRRPSAPSRSSASTTRRCSSSNTRCARTSSSSSRRRRRRRRSCRSCSRRMRPGTTARRRRVPSADAAEALARGGRRDRGAFDAVALQATRATKPDAFISSTNCAQVGGGRRRVPCGIAHRLVDDHEAAGQQAHVRACACASASSCCFTPAATSSFCATIMSTTAGDVGARTSVAYLSSRVRKRS